MFYPQWLANTVVVKKKTGKWRVCVWTLQISIRLAQRPFTYTSNRSFGGCDGKSSSDEFFGCLLGIPPDTPSTRRLGKYNFCYSCWKLSLQSDALWLEKRRINLSTDDDQMSEPQLGRSIEVYIDDMVVKSKVASDHVEDLTNIFEILREHKLRLNASKCSFGVGSGKFLGYMVTHRGIEVNPD